MKSAKCFKTPILTYNHYMQEDHLEYIWETFYTWIILQKLKLQFINFYNKEFRHYAIYMYIKKKHKCKKKNTTGTFTVTENSKENTAVIHLREQK